MTGPVGLTLRERGEPGRRRIRATVRDRGRWLGADPPDQPPRVGLTVMRSCMSSVHIEATALGTTVTMTSRSVTGDRPDTQLFVPDEWL
jgi:hypothetical protein